MIKAVFMVLGLSVVSYMQLKRVRVARPEMLVYVGTMVVVAVLGSLMLMGIKPPSPVRPLEAVFEGLGKVILQK